MTRTDSIRPGATPSTLICVCGEASGVFGAGEIVSASPDVAAAAEANSASAKSADATATALAAPRARSFPVPRSCARSVPMPRSSVKSLL